MGDWDESGMLPLIRRWAANALLCTHTLDHMCPSPTTAPRPPLHSMKHTAADICLLCHLLTPQ